MRMPSTIAVFVMDMLWIAVQMLELVEENDDEKEGPVYL